MADHKSKLSVALEFLGANEAVQKADKVSHAVEGMKKGFEGIGEGGAKIGEGIKHGLIEAGLLVGEGLREFAGLETALTKLGTLLPGGAAEANRYGEEIEKMGRKFAVGGEAVTDVLAIGKKAGMDMGTAMEFADVALKTSVGGFVDVKTAAGALTNVIKAYGYEASEATRISNIMFAAQRNGGVEFALFSDSIQKVAPLAANAGVEFKDLATILGGMGKIGLNPEQGVMALTQVMTAIAKTAGGKVNPVLKQMKIDLSTAALHTRGLIPILEEIAQKSGGNEDVIMKIFGNPKLFKTLAPLLSARGQEAIDYVAKGMDPGFSAMERSFAERAKNLGFQFKRGLETLKGATHEIGIAFVDTFGGGGTLGSGIDWFETQLPRIGKAAKAVFESIKRGFENLNLGGKIEAVKGVFDRLMGTLDRFAGSDASGKVIDTALAVAVLSAALIPLGLVLGPVVKILSGLWGVLSGAWGVLEGLGGALAGLGASMAAIVGGILLVFAALVVGIVEDVEGVGNAFWIMVDSFKGFFDAIKVFAQGVWDFLSPVFSAIVEIVSAVFGPVFIWIAKLFEEHLSPAFQQVGVALGKLGVVFQGIWDFVSPVFLPMLSTLSDLVGGALVGAFGLLADGLRTIAEILSTVCDWIVDLINGWRDIIGLAPIAEKAIKKTQGKEDVGGGIAPGPSTADNLAALDRAFMDAAYENQSMAYQTVTTAAEAVSKRPIYTKVDVNLNGGKVGSAIARANLDVTERSGAKVTPFQRRAIIEKGASLAPARG